MTDDLMPLPIWGTPEPGDIDLLRAAKASLSLDYQIVPVPAVPGSPTRVLALRVTPPFACEHALIRDPRNADALRAGMLWALNPSVVDERAVTMERHLSIMFGGPVKEVHYVSEPDW